MRILSAIFFSLICAIGITAQSLVIRDVTVIDGTGKPARPHMSVWIKDGRIESVDRSTSENRSAAGYREIDGRGKFLIPGLWDTHLHLVDIGEEAIPILPYYGITSVRDMGGDIPKLKKWRSQIESGKLVGPRIKLCGPMLEDKWDPTSVGGRTDHWPVSDPEAARSVVARLKNEGVACIKARSYASPETFLALAAAAKEAGLLFGGHPPYRFDPIMVSSAGQRTIEHAFYPWPWADLPDERRKEIMDTFRKNGTLVVPSLIAWNSYRLTSAGLAAFVNDVAGTTDPRMKFVSPSLRKNWRFGIEDYKTMNAGSPGWLRTLDQHYDLVAEMNANGVGMMIGTDTGAPYVFPGSSVHEELKLLVARSKFTPMDALLAATLIPAKLFGLDSQLGTIEKGKLADLVLLSADPLAEISNTERIDAVMVQGRWHDRKSLNGIANRVVKKVRANSK